MGKEPRPRCRCTTWSSYRKPLDCDEIWDVLLGPLRPQRGRGSCYRAERKYGGGTIVCWRKWAERRPVTGPNIKKIMKLMLFHVQMLRTLLIKPTNIFCLWLFCDTDLVKTKKKELFHHHTDAVRLCLHAEDVEMLDDKTGTGLWYVWFCQMFGEILIKCSGPGMGGLIGVKNVKENWGYSERNYNKEVGAPKKSGCPKKKIYISKSQVYRPLNIVWWR